MDKLREKLMNHAEQVITKKLERLQSRRFVLFPWLRTRRLLRLYKFSKDALK